MALSKELKGREECGTCAHFSGKVIKGIGWCIAFEAGVRKADLVGECAYYNEKKIGSTDGTK